MTPGCRETEGKGPLCLHPLAAESYLRLGRCALAATRHAYADRFLLHALAIQERSFGSEHQHLAKTLSALAELRTAQERTREAAALIRTRAGVRPNVARYGTTDREEHARRT
jgi:uncharacterized protein HemY